MSGRCSPRDAIVVVQVGVSSTFFSVASSIFVHNLLTHKTYQRSADFSVIGTNNHSEQQQQQRPWAQKNQSELVQSILKNL